MSRWLFQCWMGLFLAMGLTATVQAQGIILSAGGPVNRSMGGASTAAPLDSIGALYWNPATTAGLQNELGFGVDLLLPVLSTSSSVAGFGSGTTDAEPGVAAIPNIGWVHRNEDSPITYGLGLLGLAGFKTNYSASTTNPLFLPQPNAPSTPGGLGQLYTEAQFLQLAPTITISLSEELAIGFGPTLTLGTVHIDPLVIAAPDDADGSGAPRYPRGNGTRTSWGGGAQVGAYYIHDSVWHFGASLKSPQWMEPLRYQTQDESGNLRLEKFKLDLPMILSLGAAYSGIQDIVFALDVRYFNYSDTAGFKASGFAPDGRLLGLGGGDIMSVAAGMQYRMTDSLYVRGGYTFNQSLFSDSEATIGTLAPIFYQHTWACGASYEVGPKVWLNIAYAYVANASLDGPILTPYGPVPGGTMRTTESAHDLIFGVTMRR